MTPVTRSVLLHVGSISAGAVAAVSATASSGVDLYSAYNHAVTGVKELMLAWAIIGPVLMIGTAAWKATTKSKTQDVLNDPRVKGIITEPTLEGRELAASIPGPTVVAAGTGAAQTLAAH